MPRGRPTKRFISETHAECMRCSQTKVRADFYKRGDKPTPYCKECQRKISKEQHSKNKEKNSNAISSVV